MHDVFGEASAPAWAVAVEHSALGLAMRSSDWLYPAIETAHILSFVVLVGAIVVYDLRILGFRRAIPAVELGRLAIPLAGPALASALMTGLALFSAEASTYATSWIFITKMGLLALAAANIAWVHLSVRPFADRPIGSIARVGAALSIVLWPSVVVCGRLIAYL
jgi:hypothetical protein